uniref:Uncharacterized protein n=1 Tax=Ananas comosus var. bracteatus TaxID=296719 RepID=A0A6V7P534_ANACO|nr:unnamed protein product [Ananas comosus var. bracteatus]
MDPSSSSSSAAIEPNSVVGAAYAAGGSRRRRRRSGGGFPPPPPPPTAAAAEEGDWDVWEAVYGNNPAHEAPEQETEPGDIRRARISVLALMKMTLDALSGGLDKRWGVVQGRVVGDAIVVMDSFHVPGFGIEDEDEDEEVDGSDLNNPRTTFPPRPLPLVPLPSTPITVATPKPPILTSPLEAAFFLDSFPNSTTVVVRASPRASRDAWRRGRCRHTKETGEYDVGGRVLVNEASTARTTLMMVSSLGPLFPIEVETRTPFSVAAKAPAAIALRWYGAVILSALRETTLTPLATIASNAARMLELRHPQPSRPFRWQDALWAPSWRQGVVGDLGVAVGSGSAVGAIQ